MFLSNKLNITNNFKSNKLRELFIYCAPVGARWYTIITNPNTFGHLISMTFFIAIIPLVTLKKNIYRISIIIMQSLNLIAFFFAGSRGSFVSLAFGLIIFIFYLLFYLIKKGNWKILLSLIIGVSLIILIGTLILYKHNLTSFISKSIFRSKSLTTGTGRLDTWSKLLKLPFLSNIFGFNDNYLYNYLNNLHSYYPQGFLNNEGRAHNMFIEVLVSYGIFAFIIFISCIIKTFFQMYKNHKNLNTQNHFIFVIFAIQFITILVGGMFEQLPLFSLSAHAVIFMFVWANLISLTEYTKQNTN
ncbi:MAG: O-antigen ligase family protein [Spirochaetaceae bacterium]|nr:O-antigen ligase family protein [Spirochaetaceae bacterium]